MWLRNGCAPKRATLTVCAVGKHSLVAVVLALDEVRQHFFPAPAIVARRAPAVIVGGLASDIDQPVDRRRSAEPTTARPIDLATVHVGFWLGVIAVVVDGVEHRFGVTNRDVNPQVVVFRAGFQQANRIASILGQPVR